MTTGSRNRQAAIQTTGIPSWAPGRSQAAAGGRAGGGRIAAGSSGCGGGARGPNPSWAATAISAQATAPMAATPKASSIGVTRADPIATWAKALPVAIATRAMRPPRATGAPIANRISSRDQATGWLTFATTAITVRPTISPTNGRLPNPGTAGQLVARYPT